MNPILIRTSALGLLCLLGMASPALAKFIREKLEGAFGPEYGQLAEILQRHRPAILKLPQERRRAVWEAIINEGFLNRVKEEGIRAVEVRVSELVHGQSAV